MRLIILTTPLLMLGLVTATPTASASQRAAATSAPVLSVDFAARSKKRKHYSEQGRIACTKYGCHRIPANCMPDTEYYWNGLPTGYDRVVCR